MQTRFGGQRKYDALLHALRALAPDQGRITLTFAEIEAVLGQPLPDGAWTPAFWRGVPRKPRPWRTAGFQALLDWPTRRVEFRRVQE